jgi:hypothetical protein
MDVDKSLGAECLEKTEKFRAQCESLRQHIKELFEQSQGKNIDPQLLNSGARILLHIKESHRDMSATQEQLHKSRDQQTHKSDALRLQLQNLQYEAYHLRKKIAKCKMFSSRHTQIDLVPIEEFNQYYRPETYNTSSNIQENEHKLMILRLQHELEQRKNLLNQFDELTAKKSALQSANQQKQAFLAGLRDNLKEYENINKKIAEFMKIDSKKTEDFDCARVLPTPLYILYNNLLSYQLHFDQSIGIHLDGNLKEGREVLTAMIVSNVDSHIYNIEEVDESVEATDIIQPVESSNSDLMDEEEDDAQQEPPKKKVKTIIPASVKDARFKLFPISIVVEVPVSHKDGTRTITIKFSYLINCKIIVVSEAIIKGEAVMLPTLVPNDDGTRSPSAQHLSSYDFTHFEAGRPYKWAQWPAGLDHLEPPSTRDPNSPSPRLTISTIIKLIRYKIRAEKALSAQLKDLERRKLPDINKELFEKRFEMTNFSLESSNHNEKCYVAVFVRDENRVKIRCRIYIAMNDYPLQPPRFQLSLDEGDMGIRNFEVPDSMKHLVLDNRALAVRNRSESVELSLKDIERDLNETFLLQLLESDKYSEKSENNENHFALLSKLMAHLWTCINVYGTVEVGSGKRIATRDHRGRDRKVPTRFDTLLNLFDQVQM